MNALMLDTASYIFSSTPVLLTTRFHVQTGEGGIGRLERIKSKHEVSDASTLG